MMRKKSCTAAALTLTLVSALAFANEGPKTEHVVLQPAKRYSGSIPVDLSNGLSFNNGTYGMQNAEYEAWSTAPTEAVGLSAKPYPFEAKDRFVDTLEDRLAFYDAAIWGWNKSSSETKPEVLEYAKQAIAAITVKLDVARKALDKANSAGKGNWQNSESEARMAFLELQSTYYSLHHNPVR